jgi:hypothetical protein
MMHQREVGEAYEASTSALEAAKGQRLSLRRAIAALENALNTPAEEAPTLPDRLGGALEQLERVFALHIEVTEAPDGLYQEILAQAPRLANRVNRFRREHTEIAQGIRRGVDESAKAGGDAAAVAALRDHAVRLFADLVRHRKRGLDLVYEAYHVDLGGES